MSMPAPPPPPPARTADEAIAEMNDLYVRVARERAERGAEVPAMEIPRDAPLARESCEATAKLMRTSRSRTFMIRVPWKK